MIPRIPEPEAMDTPEEAHEYDAMDHCAVNQVFVSDFFTVHGSSRGQKILDLGTGPGQIPILLCQTDPSIRVLGVDIAHHMIVRARENVRVAGLENRIELRVLDAKHDPLEERFEAVLSNSLIHHLADPRPAVAQCLAHLAPGGTVFVRDLARPDSIETLDQLVEQYVRQETDSARAMFEASLHAALTLEEMRQLVQGLGGSPEEVQMTSDRHWTWSRTSPE